MFLSWQAKRGRQALLGPDQGTSNMAGYFHLLTFKIERDDD